MRLSLFWVLLLACALVSWADAQQPAPVPLRKFAVPVPLVPAVAPSVTEASKAAAAAPAAAKPLPGPPVEPLIDQLSSKDFKIREKARKAILALGMEALPALRTGRTHPDAEVRRMLEELIPPLERALTLTPHRVTLHVVNKPLNVVVSELAKQTGFKILLSQNAQAQMANTQDGMVMINNGGRVVRMVVNGGMEVSASGSPAQNSPARPAGNNNLFTFHFDKVPFWEVFDKISERCGVVFQQAYTGDDTLQLLMQDSYAPFSCTSGPFKIIATGFSYNRNSQLGQVSRHPYQVGRQTYEYLNLGLTIASEPRLPILKLGQVKLTCAEDEDGRSMLANADGNAYSPWQWRSNYGYWNRSVVHQTNASLSWPAKSCRTVRTLQGVIPVTVLAEQKPLVVTDNVMASKGKKLKVGATRFAMDDVTSMSNKQHQIKMTVTDEQKDGNENYNQIQTVQQRLELQDAKGNKLQFYFNRVGWGGPNNVNIWITTQPGAANVGPPAKLIYYTWNLMEHEVPFAFHGLPLP